MLTEQLEKIQCGCDRADAIEVVDRDALIRELEKLGFGGPGQAVPTDWRTYYSDDELREFILDYADRSTPAA